MTDYRPLAKDGPQRPSVPQRDPEGHDAACQRTARFVGGASRKVPGLRLVVRSAQPKGGFLGSIPPAVERVILVAILVVAAWACFWNPRGAAPVAGRSRDRPARPQRPEVRRTAGLGRPEPRRAVLRTRFRPAPALPEVLAAPYLVAASFAVFGESTATARLPFALASVLTVWLTWRIARRFSGNVLTALTAAGLLSVSLPFVLYGRQCRWYGVAMALSLLLIETEDNLDRPAARAPWLFFGTLDRHALSHELPDLRGHGRRSDHRTGDNSRLAKPDRAILPARHGGGIGPDAPAGIAFPAFGEAISGGDPASFFSSVGWVVGDLNRYLLPVPGLIVLLAFGARRLLRDAWFRRLAVVLAVAILASSLTLWSGLVTIIGFRYVVNLLPLAAVLTASVFTQALGSRPAFLAGLLVLHLATHVIGFPLSLWPPAGRPGSARADLVDGWRAVVHPVRGPIDAAVEFLEKNAKAGEYLHTPYEALPIEFYTKLRTSGMQTVGTRLAELGVTLPAYVSEVQPDGSIGCCRVARGRSSRTRRGRRNSSKPRGSWGERVA